MEERPSSSSFVHSDAFTIDAWFISHQAAIDRQPQHPPALKRQLSPQQPVHSNIQQPSAPSTSSFDASIQQPLRPPWFDRTLEGHAVLDDEDDDAGNELLDTEADGLLRPDADDEINGTLEGQVLEEEEEEEEEEEDEEDVAGLEYGDDEDGSEGWREVIQRLSAAAAARSRQEG
ncbi:hypothetical protein EDD11_006505 [Mortierella claussenii]|nr:hypothetical protein EDD11_006505 [Mortierella claussenii]